jgi:uncharacterized protein YdcH (DUF465 family)
MKVFISWSGPISKQIAQYLHEWLPMVLQYVRPYMSSEDNETGARWFHTVSTELQSSNFGILCLTRDNLNTPWIHFEAGAISQVTENSRVAPMLFQLQPSGLPGPLTQFQAKAFDKDGIYDLLKSINNAAGEEALDTRRFDRMFAALWDKLDSRIAAISNADHEASPEHLLPRSQEVGPVLEDILVLARQQSISSSSAFRLIVEQLREQTNELHNAIIISFAEGNALADLSFIYQQIVKIAYGMIGKAQIEQAEFEKLLEVLMALDKPISVLEDRRVLLSKPLFARRPPPPQAAGETPDEQP